LSLSVPAGNRGIHHLAAALFANRNRYKVTHVPIRASSALIHRPKDYAVHFTDLARLAADQYGESCAPRGRPKRHASPLCRMLRRFAEAGLPASISRHGKASSRHRKTPAEIVAKLNTEINGIVTTAEFPPPRLNDLSHGSRRQRRSAGAHSFLETEIVRWGKIVRSRRACQIRMNANSRVVPLHDHKKWISVFRKKIMLEQKSKTVTFGANEIDRQLPAGGEIFLDHVGHFVRSPEAASRALERAGFAPTPASIQVNPDVASYDAPDPDWKCHGDVFARLYGSAVQDASDTVLGRELDAALARYPGLHLAAFAVADAASATSARRRWLLTCGRSPRCSAQSETESRRQHCGFHRRALEPGIMPEGRIQMLTTTPKRRCGRSDGSRIQMALKVSSI